MNKFKNLLKKTILLAILIISPILIFASEAGVIFLLIEPGSRPGGMGQAYVAQVDDGFAQFWNPGAMAFNRKNQFAGMHVNWFGALFDDMYYEYFGWNKYYPEMSGNLGVNVTFLTFGTQERRGEDNELIGTFDSFDVSAGVSYGYQHSDNLGIGVNFKYIYSQLADYEHGESTGKGNGYSFAFDIGLLQKNLFINGLNLGVNLQNIGPDISYINNAQSDPLPMNLRLGLSYRIFADDYNKLTINGDMNKLLANNDWVLKRLITAWYDDGGFMSKIERETTIFGVGGEYVYWNLLSLRAGFLYDKNGARVGPSFGAGIQHTFPNGYHAFFNYAMEQAGELTDYNHTFSIGLDF